MAKCLLKQFLILFLVIMSNTSILCIDNDFKDVVQEFANIVASRYGTSVKWVDIKAEHPDMQQYQWAHTSFTYLKTSLEDSGMKPMQGTSDYLEQWFDNGGSKESTSVFSRTDVTEDTFSIAFTESFKYGLSEEISLELPDSVGAKVSTKLEINLSSTQSFQTKSTKTWKIEQTIKIPPGKSVLIKYFIIQDYYQDFWINSETQIDGYVAIWFNNKIDLNADPSHQSDRHWLWFIPAYEIVQKSGKKNYYFNADGYPIYNSRGKIKGNSGLKAYITIEDHDLRVSVNQIKFLE